jgi:TfuA protein
MGDTFIYLGPSLSQPEALSILEAHYLPPICRGDLATLPDHARVVGIIDGEFFQRLAVSPKEIIALLDRGIQVFGAASMGALRAAEIYRYGMVGIGEIFCMFRDGVLEGDDEVALVYDPQSYRPLSEPLVNIRRLLEIALAAEIIDEPERDRLLSQMKSLYFPERSYGVLQSLCPPLSNLLKGSVAPDVKRDDARQLLFAIKNMRRPLGPTRLGALDMDAQRSYFSDRT